MKTQIFNLNLRSGSIENILEEYEIQPSTEGLSNVSIYEVSIIL